VQRWLHRQWRCHVLYRWNLDRADVHDGTALHYHRRPDPALGTRYTCFGFNWNCVAANEQGYVTMSHEPDRPTFTGHYVPGIITAVR
jgi:hypothetical protein